SRSKSSGNCVAGSRSREPFWSSGGTITAKCAPRRAATSAGHRTVHDGRAPPMDLNRFPPDRLRGFAAAALVARDVPATDAALVAVRRSNHLGSLGFYLRRCTAGGLVGLAFTNTPPAMSPTGARTPYLGTNPIAAGFPTPGEPVIVDMATSQVARGHILKAARL